MGVTPIAGWFITENPPQKNDDYLGVPSCMETLTNIR